MIYFDNAATGGFKPSAVTDAAITVMKYLLANPGRSGHRLSVTGAKAVENCRTVIAETFNASPERVIFTKNCTEALNVAIFGTVKRGGHVIATTFEHNSVLRPLTHLKNTGEISLDIVCPENGKDIVSAIKEKIRPNTYLIAATSVSNVTGLTLPVKKIGELCDEHGILFLCDGAQGGGHINLDMKRDRINLLALAGHKGLYGLMGSGVLVVGDGVEVSPLMFGGTGSESMNLDQPKDYPDRLECGTLNLPAIAALSEGVNYVKDNLNTFSEILLCYTDAMIKKLSRISGVKLFSAPNEAGIVSFSINGLPSAIVADALNCDYDVAVRGGLHCAPLTHKYLGTEEDGLVRASLSVQNTYREINYFTSAIERICRH